MSISTAGSPSSDPERCPFFPLIILQPWSPPKESSPGPISTRVLSIVSTYHRPEIGTIHCGAGFSCQSPSTPGGSVRNNTLAGRLLVMHCQTIADPGLTVLSLLEGNDAMLWRLTPFSSRQTFQKGIWGADAVFMSLCLPTSSVDCYLFATCRTHYP
jgi:hypothetical protein